MKRLICILIFFVACARGMEHVPAVFENLPPGVQSYLECLPKIASVNSDDPTQKAQVVTDYLVAMGGYPKNIDGRDVIQNKVSACIASNEPLGRCMPGFPVSSTNPNKIPFDDQHAFGMGDLVALLTRNHISSEIAKVHKPGSSVAIYWEPFIHDMNKICESQLGVPQFSSERVISYQGALKDMIKYLEPNVQQGNPDTEAITKIYRDEYANRPVTVDPDKVQHYEMFMKEDLESDAWLERSERKLFDAKRSDFEKKYPQIKDQTFDIIKTLPIYKKMKRNLATNKYLHNVAYDVGQCAFKGSQRMASLLEDKIPDYKNKIRESVRADYTSVKKKLMTPMIYGAKGTPWHNVLIVKPKSVDLDSYKNLVKKEHKRPKIKYYKIGSYELGYVDKEK